MLTLIGFLFTDSLTDIITPLIQENQWLGILFLTYVLLVSVLLMNLVTAVIVDNAIQSGNQLRENRIEMEDKRRADICGSLGHLFIEMDQNQDGEVDKHELMHAAPAIRDRLGEALGL